ncbi:MAG TPA: hypothetical protein VG496_00325 [Myxococcales bacterium]|nr:hypothetical protein [Myxococcales bacterium]
MAKVLASLVAAVASASLVACCGAVVFESDPGNGGATVLVAAQQCNATTEPVTSVFVDSEEVLRMNADPETVSVRWENDGATLVVSMPGNEVVVRR